MTRFNGQITIAEIAAGIEAAIENAGRLVDAASKLSATGIYAPACGLSLMALEELGKLEVFMSMAQRGGLSGTKWRSLWTKFRSHHYKSSTGLLAGYPDEIRGDPDKLFGLAVWHDSTAEQVEKARQSCFYVDFDPQTREWVSPQALEQPDMLEVHTQAQSALERARNHLAAGLYSVPALELLRTIYEPFLQGLQESTTAGEVFEAVRPLHQEYFRRLAEAGILDPESGIDLLL